MYRMPQDGAEPQVTERVTDPRMLRYFKRMLVEANKVYVENKTELELLAIELPGGSLKNAEVLALIAYMAQRAAKRESRR